MGPWGRMTVAGVCVAGLVGLAGPAGAVGPTFTDDAGAEEAIGEDGGWVEGWAPLRSDSDLHTASILIQQQNFEEALAYLDRVLARNAANADALNLMGYVHRRQGDFDAAFGYYDQALAADPNHLGALNYLGYAHLAMDDQAAAEAVLARMQAICTDGCAEADDLSLAIDAHAAGFPID